jgi:hypothetical protein
MTSSLGARLVVSGIALTALLAHSASPARACSPPPPPAWPFAARSVLLPDPATAIPTNAAVFLTYEGVADRVDARLLELIELRPSGGVPVDVVIRSVHEASVEPFYRTDSFEIRPVTTLMARTTYEVLDYLTPETCQFPSSCVAETPSVVATFTTGDGPDLAPPRLTGSAQVKHDPKPAPCEDDGMCCSEHEGVGFSATWPVATDLSPGPLRYHLYREGSTQVTATIHEARLHAYVVCDGKTTGGGVGPMYYLQGKYSVRAVDLSGNESAEVASFAIGQCGGDDGGCTVGTGRARLPSGLTLLVGLLSCLVLRLRPWAKRRKVA